MSNLTKHIQRNFADDGRCADVSIFAIQMGTILTHT